MFFLCIDDITVIAIGFTTESRPIPVNQFSYVILSYRNPDQGISTSAIHYIIHENNHIRPAFNDRSNKNAMHPLRKNCPTRNPIKNDD